MNYLTIPLKVSGVAVTGRAATAEWRDQGRQIARHSPDRPSSDPAGGGGLGLGSVRAALACHRKSW